MRFITFVASSGRHVMRVFLVTAFACGITQTASAHTLNGGQNFVDSLVHQLFAAHHFSVTLLLIAACWLAVRALRKMSEE